MEPPVSRFVLGVSILLCGDEALPEINSGVVDVGDCFTFDLSGEVTQSGYVPICQIPILRFREGFSSEAGIEFAS